MPLAHLDRAFDYSVPEALSEAAVSGARVKVRFAGREVGGFIVERVATSEQKLQPLGKVVSREPVLAPEIGDLVAAVAARYAGNRSDVLRLAIPPRHARAEAAEGKPMMAEIPEVDGSRFAAYDGGVAFLKRLSTGESPRAVLNVLPGDDWAEVYADVAVATARSGRGVLMLVPDARDLARLDAALVSRWGKQGHLTLTAEAGPQRRYTNFLAIRRGNAKVVIGARSAAFAPVHDLGLVAIWDDGDDLYDEPRAPYCNARDVLLLRAHATSCGTLIAGYAQSTEAHYLVRTGWAEELSAPRENVRERVAITIAGADERGRSDLARTARLPREAFDAIRAGLNEGPVLVQTPRAGYVSSLACERCRQPARCSTCNGPLRIPASGAAPSCAWCGSDEKWRCPRCLSTSLRAPVLGDRRTAEELGRAFPGVPVHSSSGDSVMSSVKDKPTIVVATQGGEPVAPTGFASVILLDTWLSVARGGLRAEEEAFRRWANAAALVRPRNRGGRVVAVGDAALASLQALVRWDPSGFAEREITERIEAHLPPASVVASLNCPRVEAETLAASTIPDAMHEVAGLEVLGPVGIDDETVQFVLRAPRTMRPQFQRGLRDLQAARSTRKLPHLRVQVDPRDLG